MAKSCTFVVLVLKINSRGRKWFRIGGNCAKSGTDLVNNCTSGKEFPVPSTAGACKLVQDPAICTQLTFWRQSMLPEARSPATSYCRVTCSAQCLAEHFDIIHDQLINRYGTTLSLPLSWDLSCHRSVAGINSYVLCIKAVKITVRSAFSPESEPLGIRLYVLWPLVCHARLGTALSVCSLCLCGCLYNITKVQSLFQRNWNGSTLIRRYQKLLQVFDLHATLSLTLASLVLYIVGIGMPTISKMTRKTSLCPNNLFKTCFNELC